jgi:hypothetical protein
VQWGRTERGGSSTTMWGGGERERARERERRRDRERKRSIEAGQILLLFSLPRVPLLLPLPFIILLSDLLRLFSWMEQKALVGPKPKNHTACAGAEVETEADDDFAEVAKRIKKVFRQP